MTPIRDHARVLDDTSRERLRQDKNLLPGILDKIEKGHTPMKSATKLRFAALLLALTLTLAFFTLPGVATALKRLLGYVPGVGPVDASSSLRVLAEPVTETRDGFTITVESALLDSSQTVIQYRIEGPFPVQGSSIFSNNLCRESPILRLADGTQLSYPAGEYGGNDRNREYKDTFGALPADQNQATLILPCVRDQLIAEKPFNWEIPLRFAPAPADMPVYPVLELPTPTPLPSGQAGFENGFRLDMEQMAEVPDGFYLKGRLSWQADPAFSDVEFLSDAVRVVDSAGQTVLFLEMPTAETSVDQSISLSMKVEAPRNPGPVQVLIDYVGLEIISEATSSISIDVGDNPQPGQVWPLNQDLLISGYPLRVISAEYLLEAANASPILKLNLQAGPEVLFASFLDDNGYEIRYDSSSNEYLESKISGTGGSQNLADGEPFAFALYYKEFPRGKISLSNSFITVRRNGPWMTTWNPPTVDPSTPARQLAGPITDTRDGFTITVKNISLTAAGTTLTYLIEAPYPFDSRTGLVTDACFQTTTLRLADGREKTTEIREGFGDDDEMEYTENYPALSLSETPVSLVFSCITGTLVNQGPQDWEIPLANFVAAPPAEPDEAPSPTATLPPGKACVDQSAVESALGSSQVSIPGGLGGKLAFWQGDGELGEMTVSSLDGSGRIALGPGLFPSISPDGRTVFYRGSDNGLHIRDLASGADLVVPGTAAPKVYNNNPAWSPDGRQIVFSRFADDDSDIYLVNADGSDLRAIVTGPEQQSFLGWAPDSQSISYSTYKDEAHRFFILSLQTGESREIESWPSNVGTLSISPDGRRLVYGTDQGMFITDTVDFAPRLLFDNSLQLGYPLVWSPDSQWLGLGYWGADGNGPVRLVLLHPETCQLIILPESRGFLSSWVP